MKLALRTSIAANIGATGPARHEAPGSAIHAHGRWRVKRSQACEEQGGTKGGAKLRLRHKAVSSRTKVALSCNMR